MKITTKLLATCAAIGLLAIATVAQAGTLYTLGQGGEFGTIDTDSGAYASIATGVLGASTVAASLASDGKGNFYTTTSDSSFFSVTTGGVASELGTDSIQAYGMSLSSGGTLYAYDYNDDSFGTINTSTGEYTLKTDPDISVSSPYGRFAFLGDKLYATMAIDDDLFGTYSLAGIFSEIANDGMYGSMQLASDGTTLYGLTMGSLYTINPLDGALSNAIPIIGIGGPIEWAGAAFATTSGSAVPEPATLLGFGVPMLMVGLGKLRQLRK